VNLGIRLDQQKRQLQLAKQKAKSGGGATKSGRYSNVGSRVTTTRGPSVASLQKKHKETEAEMDTIHADLEAAVVENRRLVEQMRILENEMIGATGSAKAKVSHESRPVLSSSGASILVPH
jgi:hypothetical protein